MILHTGRREFIRDLSLAGAGLACGGCAGSWVANGSPDLTVGIVSDVHVPIAGEERMRLAFSLFDRRKVDAVMICGDLTHYGMVRELERFHGIWQRAFPGNRRSDGVPIVPLIVYGDHDTGSYAHEFNNCEHPCKLHGVDRAAIERELIAKVGSGKVWKQVFGEDWDYVQVKDVKGYRFILSHYYGTIHQQPSPNLEATFSAAVAGIPSDRPFFFVQHRVYPNTVEAYPWCSEWWCADCDASRKLLSRHRNAVAICGHAHSNVLNERNFWRGEFTAVEVPSLSQLAYPRASGVDRSKADETSAQCLIMGVWPHSVAFERLDARLDKSIAPDWTARI